MPGYMSGFGNGFESEALEGALPIGRNSPQKVAFGLYAEQLSGSPFTAPRATNERSWLYRIRPSVAHWGDFTRVSTEAGTPTESVKYWRSAPDNAPMPPIAQMRWDPLWMPSAQDGFTFITGIRTMTTAGDVGTQTGCALSVYTIAKSMVDEYFYNGDAEMLFVLEHGDVRFWTE